MRGPVRKGGQLFASVCHTRYGTSGASDSPDFGDGAVEQAPCQRISYQERESLETTGCSSLGLRNQERTQVHHGRICGYASSREMIDAYVLSAMDNSYCRERTCDG